MIFSSQSRKAQRWCASARRFLESEEQGRAISRWPSAARKPSLLERRIPTMRLEPTNIQQIGDELAIAWSDGTESFSKLELLRRACPCAACGGEPDVLGHVARPHVSYGEKSFELVGFNLVGGYALQPRWA